MNDEERKCVVTPEYKHWLLSVVRPQAEAMLDKAEALDNNPYNAKAFGCSYQEFLANPSKYGANYTAWQDTLETGEISDIGCYSYEAYLADYYVSQLTYILGELDWENREDQY